MKPIPYGKQDISEDDIEAVAVCLRSDFLTQGPMVGKFEEGFASYIGATYAVAVSNGTAALHLSALALGVKKGARVITTPITFSASANCVLYCGGTVEFCDIDPVTGLMDLEQLEIMLRQKPHGFYSGVIPVDLAGFPVNLERLKLLAEEYGLFIIEDACHSPGGYFTDSRGGKQNCGNGEFADLSVFSFHPVKHIATGEGGMITTNNKALYNKLMQLRTHGITKDPELMSRFDGGWYMEMQMLGYNYRISDILCALGTSQLKKAETGIVRRTEIACKYDDAFMGNGCIRPLTPGGTKDLIDQGIQHAHHLYIILSDKRKALYDYLRKHNIFSQVHYIPVHLMPFYENLGFKKGDFPNAERYYDQCLSLPMYSSLSDDEQQYVIDRVFEFCKQ